MSGKIELTDVERSLSDRLEQVIQFGAAVSDLTASDIVRKNAEFLQSLARIGLHYRQRYQKHLADVSKELLANGRELAKLRDELDYLKARCSTLLNELERMLGERQR